MFIKSIDFLSPPVTFYYNNSLSHSSIISGIISIISIILIICLAIYFSLELIQRKEPNAFYFNSFIDDAGKYPLNSSSLFHFLSLSNTHDNSINDANGIDFTYFRIVGSEVYFDAFLSDKNLTKYDHWLYGYCNNDSDTKGIGYLIKNEYFTNYACIRKYYNSTERKYYDTENPNFRWPEIAHGTYNPNYKFYNLFVQKCQQDTISLILGEGHHCKSDKEIDDFISKVVIGTFYFINHYIDILNYKHPNTKFFFRIENNFQKNIYSTNHLNFNPSLIKTHNGLILEKVIEEKSYIYERNDVFSGDSKGNDIYCIYVLWLKNTMNYYERTYKKIQAVISSIGGINQVIVLIATYINSFYNQYIVLSDTESLLHSSIDKEKGS